MANERIYSIDWRKLLLWLIPTPLRKLTLLQWLSAATYPLQRILSIFLLHRNTTNYWLGINSQVCFLEKMLNDKYDPLLRRIYIGRPETFDPLYIYTRDELKPVYLYTRAEDNPQWLYTRAETLLGTIDFFVIVPIDIIANFIEMNALIDKHKLPDKTHAIKRV